jgi:hypothetical protein
MSFASFFSQKPQQPQQQQGAGNQNPNATQNNQQVQNNNQNPGPKQPDGSQNPGPQKEANPLDAYTKLWDTPSTDGVEKAPVFDIGEENLGKLTEAQDFMKGIDPELMKRAQTGDAPAMVELLHGVNKNTYKTVMTHLPMLVDKYVQAREGYNEKGLSKKVQKELTGHALSSIPNASHPAVKKQLSMLADGFQAQHPDATPQEIVEMTRKFMIDITGAITPQQSSQEGSEKKGPTNWDSFFDEQPNSMN